EVGVGAEPARQERRIAAEGPVPVARLVHAPADRAALAEEHRVAQVAGLVRSDDAPALAPVPEGRVPHPLGPGRATDVDVAASAGVLVDDDGHGAQERALKCCDTTSSARPAARAVS